MMAGTWKKPCLPLAVPTTTFPPEHNSRGGRYWRKLVLQAGSASTDAVVAAGRNRLSKGMTCGRGNPDSAALALFEGTAMLPVDIIEKAA